MTSEQVDKENLVKETLPMVMEPPALPGPSSVDIFAEPTKPSPPPIETPKSSRSLSINAARDMVLSATKHASSKPKQFLAEDIYAQRKNTFQGDHQRLRTALHFIQDCLEVCDQDGVKSLQQWGALHQSQAAQSLREYAR